MKCPLTFPPLTVDGEAPEWTGREFIVDGRRLNVLKYNTDDRGWNDGLTVFHEETAGEYHPIDIASRERALGQLKQHLKIDHPVILEIGSSSGAMLREIKTHIPGAMVVGSDCFSDQLERLGPELNIPTLQFDLTQCPLPDSCIDAVVLLNVLEHIEEDQKALMQIRRIVKPDGILVLEVPAGPGLYDVYDKFLNHYRRYDGSALKRMVEETGFTILNRTHLGFFIYPAFWISKKKNRLVNRGKNNNGKKTVSRNIQTTQQSRLLRMLLKWEMKLSSSCHFPFGIRCTMTCANPKNE